MKYLQSVERQYQPSILHPEKLSFNTEEIKTFSDLKKKKKLREFIVHRPVLQETLREILQGEGK